MRVDTFNTRWVQAMCLQAWDGCHSFGCGTWALQHAGLSVAGGAELDQRRHALYQSLHDNTCTDNGDVAALVGQGMPANVALLLLTTPCQCFSYQAKAAPLARLDERECMLPTARALAKMPWVPPMILLENIPSMLTVPLEPGWPKGSFLQEAVKLLRVAGYNLCMCSMCGSWSGVAQTRPRIFLCGFTNMGHLGAFLDNPPQPLAPPMAFSEVCGKGTHLWEDTRLLLTQQGMHRLVRELQRAEQHLVDGGPVRGLDRVQVVSPWYPNPVQCIGTKGGNVGAPGYGTYVAQVGRGDERCLRQLRSGDFKLVGEEWQPQVRALSTQELCKLFAVTGAAAQRVCDRVAHLAEAHELFGDAVIVPHLAEVAAAMVEASGGGQRRTGTSSRGIGWMYKTTYSTIDMGSEGAPGLPHIKHNTMS